jgi:hypothetical protein
MQFCISFRGHWDAGAGSIHCSDCTLGIRSGVGETRRVKVRVIRKAGRPRAGCIYSLGKHACYLGQTCMLQFRHTYIHRVHTCYQGRQTYSKPDLLTYRLAYTSYACILKLSRCSFALVLGAYVPSFGTREGVRFTSRTAL